MFILYKNKDRVSGGATGTRPLDAFTGANKGQCVRSTDRPVEQNARELDLQHHMRPRDTQNECFCDMVQEHQMIESLCGRWIWYFDCVVER